MKNKIRFHPKVSIFHFILVVLNLVSFILILQINLRLIPLIPLIEVNISQEYADSVNTLISNIAQGILISSFFYYLLSYLPETRKSKIIRQLIESRLKVIVDQMAISITYFNYKYEINIDNTNGYTLDDSSKFLLITELTKNEMNFQYNVFFIDHTTCFSTGKTTEIEHFVREKRIVMDKINEILSMQNIIYEDIKLVELLNLIKDSWFYNGVDSFNETYPQFPNAKKVVGGFNVGVQKYYEYFIKLSEYVRPCQVERRTET